MSFHVEFHPPGLPGTGQKVFGGGGWVGGGWSKVSLVFCFGPTWAWPWTWTKLNNNYDKSIGKVMANDTANS